MFTPARDSNRCVSEDEASPGAADMLGVTLLYSLDCASPACNNLKKIKALLNKIYIQIDTYLLIYFFIYYLFFIFIVYVSRGYSIDSDDIQ